MCKNDNVATLSTYTALPTYTALHMHDVLYNLYEAAF